MRNCSAAGSTIGIALTRIHLTLPDLASVARHTSVRVIEGVVIPLALFLVGLRVFGAWGAMTVGLVWAYGLIAARLFMRRRVPGILLLGTVTITARTLIALSAHSITLYFLQPSLGSALIAGAFLVSVVIDRPLAARLAGDFCPLSTEVHANEHVRRFFRQISLLWAFAQAANAGVTIWLLFSQSIGTFVVLRSVVSASVTVSAILASSLWFRRSMARNGIDVIWPRLRPVRA
jgi:intracellular septation protein A